MKQIKLSTLNNAKAAPAGNEVLLWATDASGEDVEIGLPTEHLPPALLSLSSALTDVHRRETGVAGSNHTFPASGLEIRVREGDEGDVILAHFEIVGGMKLTVALPSAAAADLAKTFAAIAQDETKRSVKTRR